MAKTHTYTNDHEWYQSGLNVRAGDKLIGTATDHYHNAATLYEEKLANARLMAAAPALLDTLLHLLPNLQKHDMNDDVRAVMQAIGLALGNKK